MKARTRALTIAGLALGLLLGSLPAAEAAHHLVRIKQVSPGSAANPQSEWVVLQLTSPNEHQFGSAVSVRLYSASGAQTNVVTSTGNAPNSLNQAAVLAATTAAQGEFTATADLLLPNMDALSPAGGAVCLTSTSFGPLDCVGWGTITFSPGSPPSPIGTAEAAIPDGQMLERSIAANCPTLHESADDTNNSANDFAPGAFPAMLRQSDSPITESPCPSLSVSRIGSGTGTVTGTGINCPSDCFEQYAGGTPVTLTATPTGGSTFGGFSPNCAPFGTDQCSVTMSSSLTVTATFTAPPGGGGSGTTPAFPPSPPTKKCKKGQKLKKGKCVKKKKKRKK